MQYAPALQPADTTLATARAGGTRWAVPVEDLGEFATLPEARRTEIHYTLRVLAILDRRIAEIGKGAAVAEVVAHHKHAMRGLSAPSLHRKYSAVQAGGWRALVKGYKAPNKQPDAFVTEIRRVAELNHRSQEEAFEQIREAWARGEHVPGYGTWMDLYVERYPERPMPKVWPRGFYPKGWSTRNMRRYGPTKGARVLFQRGVLAAKRHFPSVRRDPSSLRPLELITIDDFELDALCVFPGDANHRPQIGRVAGLLAIDVATRRKLHWGLGQRMEREERQGDGTVRTVRTGIARVDMQGLLHELFRKYGLPDYTVTILVENASASINPEMQLCIETLFEGRVKIERTGMINHKALTNGFVEKGGKPFEKGWIEATFNQLWNYLGAMKGYKGSNQRLNAPATLEDAIRYTKLLLGQGDRALNLPPEQIAQLRLPFPNMQELEAAFAWAVELSHTRTKHSYIGFRTVTEYLIEDGTAPVPFAELALLPVERQLQVQPVERMETTIERWNDLARSVTWQAIPPSVLALLLLTPKKVTYRNHQVTFVHERTGYTYLDTEGTALAGLTDGTELLAYFQPANPEHIQLVDLRGNYLGQLRRLGGAGGRVDIKDKAALAEAAEMTATVFNREVAGLRERHADKDAQHAADRAHNDAIIDAHRAETAHLTKAEKIAAASTDAERERRARIAEQRAVDRRAAKITADDRADFLGGAEPAAAAGNDAADHSPAETLGDYL